MGTIKIANYELVKCYDADTNEEFYDVSVFSNADDIAGKYIGELDKCDVEQFMEDDEVIDVNGLLDLIESM